MCENPSCWRRVVSLNRLHSRAQPCPPAKGRTGQTCSVKKYLFTSPEQVTQAVKMWRRNSLSPSYRLGPQKPPQNQQLGQHISIFLISSGSWRDHILSSALRTLPISLMTNDQFERDQQCFLKNILSITSGGHPFTEGSLSRFKKKVKATLWKDVLSPRHC